VVVALLIKLDTLENGALMHGVDVDDLITRLKKFISSVPISVEFDIEQKKNILYNVASL
jgi:hypothetical protein